MLVSFVKQSWLVMVAALVFGLLVAGVYGALEETIEKQRRLKLERKMAALLSDASVFQAVADSQGNPEAYYKAKDPCDAVVGYAVVVSGGGFADKIELLVAFDSDLVKLKGIAVMASSETPGFGDKIKHASKGGKTSFKDQFIGCPISAKLAVIKTGDIDIADEQLCYRVSVPGCSYRSSWFTP